MTTQIWTFIDGKRVDIPAAPYEAEEFGWHKGVEFKSSWTKLNNIDDEIYEWCRATFDPHIYKVFIRGVWFYREQDAMLCKLRWA